VIDWHVRLSDWLTDATHRLSATGISPAEARLEARLLAQHGLGFTREQIVTRSQDPIDSAALEPLLTRRLAREPLAYILGERAFYGLDFYVTPAVLIPRPETELLVEVVLSLRGGGGPLLADIGTGSGCIAVTLAKRLPDAAVFATDISDEALAIARKNAERHEVELTLLQGDLLAPLPAEMRFDVIVSNPPYIARSESETLAPEVLGEPHTALFDTDADGLGFYRRLAAGAPARLNPNGLLAVEVGQGQAVSVARLFEAVGFERVTVLPDLAGIDRVVRGIWRPWPKTASDEGKAPL
jgi:release factor glutamine methyltransferase